MEAIHLRGEGFEIRIFFRSVVTLQVSYRSERWFSQITPSRDILVCSKLCGYHIIICRTSCLHSSEIHPMSVAKASTGLSFHLLQVSSGLHGQLHHPHTSSEVQQMWCPSLQVDLTCPIYHCNLPAMFQNTCSPRREKGIMGKEWYQREPV